MAIGRQMRSAALTAAHSPGLTITRLGRLVGPHGSIQYGYAIVLRALKAGLVRETDCEEALCPRPAKNHRHIFVATEEVN